ncbi:sensor histidine kinase [Aliikangiella marina]|uniref:Sensor histidine kinase n=1 Tax=Aliikangiella marina TaxID=1712262 RepID=A0A545TC06_9GAMM|nr:sensor histidine kinase [Aliikangiella marina]TQV74747.1 sensor histidine kinase [Aliikangiella marina]
MVNLLKKIDAFLLPPQEEMRYAAYVWLVYLAIFFVSLYNFQRSNYGTELAIVGTLAFLYFYFHAYWANSQTVAWDILAIAAIGSVLGYITPGASVFFVFAGAFCCRLGKAKKAVFALAIMAVWVVFLSWLFDLSAFFYIPAIGFMWMIGGINIYQFEMDKKKKELKLSREEIRTLAKTAERERIARDLHDLIGHTFSVITLKAELAGKLINKDNQKAKDEIKELENISRDALKQVREVVTGYRTSDLNTELAHAKYVLESNDIQFQYSLDEFELDDATNKELAIVLKELVTNVLKHSGADKVSAEIYQQSGDLVMIVRDNGKGLHQEFDSKHATKGFGLTGIQERVAKLSGVFSVSSDSGACFQLKVPLEVSGK